MAKSKSEPTGLGVEDFVALPEEEDYRLELTEGRLLREPAPGPRHGMTALRIGSLLRELGQESGLGVAFVDTAFTLGREPATVRVPDVAFVSAERIPEEEPGDGFWELAPDIAVDVLSPSNSVSEIQRKAMDYLDAGSRLVWIVDPRERTVTIYQSRTEIRILTSGDVLDAVEVVPAFRVPVEELFE